MEIEQKTWNTHGNLLLGAAFFFFLFLVCLWDFFFFNRREGNLNPDHLFVNFCAFYNVFANILPRLV